ncbi:undecaprenyl-diphosphate phosphatase [Muribaculaceae bacterium Isolate-002 (NCI)]|nr:undecaprenyl-diphosphate phosphatase [Muribaculaceae bacterium Isolate-002 (NCI)]
MDWFDSLIMGVVQGLAEYLPISSSGHLQICEDILHLNMEGAGSLQYTVALHVATVLSTIVVLWKEFLPLVTSFFGFKRDANTTYVFKILVSCIPIMIVGLFFKDKVETLFEKNLLTVGIALCCTALLLTFAYYFRRTTADSPALRQGGYRPRDITFLDAFVIGLAQAVAVIPGLSRSGSTIATGLMLGDKREQIAKFSFFMVIIPILGEALLDVKDMVSVSGDAGATAETIGIVPLIIGFIAAFVVGCAACKWMLNIVKKGKLVWFAVYCLIVGLLCIIFN